MNGLVTRVSADVTTDQRTGANLLHDPRLVAAGRGRPPRRGQDHPGHAGRSLCADRRPHHVLLFDEAVQRPVHALVPREVSYATRNTNHWHAITRREPECSDNTRDEIELKQ